MPFTCAQLAGWIGCRPVVKAASTRTDDGTGGVKEVLIDLRDASLTEKDGIALAYLLRRQTHIAVDVRGNESLGEGGTSALVNFMLENYARADRPRRTLLGIRADSLTLIVPADGIPPFELRIIAAELVSGAQLVSRTPTSKPPAEPISGSATCARMSAGQPPPYPLALLCALWVQHACLLAAAILLNPPMDRPIA